MVRVEITNEDSIAILGKGNIGTAIAKGLIGSSRFSPGQIIITRRKVHLLEGMANQGFTIQSDNCDAVRRPKIIIIAVLPQQLNNLLHEINVDIDPRRHIIISVVSGVSSSEIIKHFGKELSVLRIMPTMAISINESMTCIASNHSSNETLEFVKSIFDQLGKTIIIREDQMIPATALCGCGVAFFLRAMRAASQGGIEIGFHSDESILMATQTAKGAASLLLSSKNHPEMEIDKVTTPEGCTISGLNEMEHRGFSSAMIKGIIISSEKAASLYKNTSI